MEKNRQEYEKDESVKLYSDMKMQTAELVIFNSFSNKWKSWTVLDLGMGAGRTSEYFQSKADKYLGIDYSESMVNFCLKKFKTSNAFNFDVGDARSLENVSDETFDFVLFSFNGIDCVDFDGRAKVIKEVKRVLKPNGYFCFSSHNLNFDLRKHHRIRLGLDLRNIYRSVRRFLEFRILNPNYSSVLDLDKVILRDGTASFKVSVAYVKPRYQCREVELLGFSSPRVFVAETGEEISVDEAGLRRDPWFYYLSQKL